MVQPITISSLKYVKPKHLSTLLLDPEQSKKIAVIDVRDSDYLGGHVKGSIHAPIDQLDARMPELLRVLADKDQVVFHCMLSQQRGPGAALAYARAKANAEARRPSSLEDRSRDARVDSASPRERAVGTGEGMVGGQQICVLEGGFQAWQKTIGGDARLTEGYISELWDAELV